MISRYLTIAFITFTLSACISVPQSTAPKNSVTSNKSLTINNAIKSEDIVPVHSYPIGDSGFQLVQTKGGSVFLGPLLGSLNISKNSKEMAEKIKPELSKISPYILSKNALLSAGFDDDVNSRFEITPFVFVQRCEDGFFRLSLVHHVTDSRSKWFGRYTYHIEEPVKIDNFPAGINTPEYKEELKAGASLLVDLMKKDFNGEMPNIGKKYNIGSFHLAGEKFGGMGIFLQPEELFFRDASVIEQTDSVAIIRMQGVLGADPGFGGLTFGVHYFKKSLLHTFEPAIKG